jgi:serine acetyltransferase
MLRTITRSKSDRGRRAKNAVTFTSSLGANIVGNLSFDAAAFGESGTVAAGAVVSKLAPPNTVVGGVPAKVICETDNCLERTLAKSLGCEHLKGADKAEVIRRIYIDNGRFKR